MPLTTPSTTLDACCNLQALLHEQLSGTAVLSVASKKVGNIATLQHCNIATITISCRRFPFESRDHYLGGRSMCLLDGWTGTAGLELRVRRLWYPACGCWCLSPVCNASQLESMVVCWSRGRRSRPARPTRGGCRQWASGSLVVTEPKYVGR
jgi:hypothetical protein